MKRTLVLMAAMLAGFLGPAQAADKRTPMEGTVIAVDHVPSRDTEFPAPWGEFNYTIETSSGTYIASEHAGSWRPAQPRLHVGESLHFDLVEGRDWICWIEFVQSGKKIHVGIYKRPL